jgi:hypothetical protein
MSYASVAAAPPTAPRLAKPPAVAITAAATTATASMPVLVSVKFHTRSVFHAVPDSMLYACVPGVVVVVQGHRGEDAGTVDYLVSRRNPDVHTPCVRRIATAADIKRMHAAANHCRRVLQLVRRFVADEAACNISRDRRHNPFAEVTIVGVDIQMDLRKIFIHYKAAAGHVGFGEVVTRLRQALPFRARDVRVWTNDCNSRVLHDTAPSSPPSRPPGCAPVATAAATAHPAITQHSLHPVRHR